MAFLLGLLVAFGRLSGDSEWVALQACGVTPVADAAARPRPRRRVLGGHALGAHRRRPARQPGVPRDGIPRAGRQGRERDQAQGLLRVRSRTSSCSSATRALDGAGWTDVFMADTSKPRAPQVSVARRGRMLVDRAKQKVELALEDSVAYQMGTDAQGRAEYQENPSQFAPEGVERGERVPEGRPDEGRRRAHHRGARGPASSNSRSRGSPRTGPTTSSR